ncbi:MAG: SRPBCC family protein [Pseudomonadota bacterium]
MMTILRILAALVVVLILVALGGFLLPRDVSVSRSIDIDAPADAIFPYVNSMQKTSEWSPWLDRDPDIQLSYGGPDAGVGNTMSWTSDVPDVGSGSQEITASTENSQVKTALDFGDMGTADATFDLAPEGTGTKVTWSFHTDTGMNPVMRYFGLMMDGFVGPDYETGLENLKTLVESNASS